MKRILLFMLTAVIVTSSFVIPAAAEEGDTIEVGADGSVNDSGYDGPQITKVRVLNEGRFLEIYWDRYVDENEAVNPSNFTLKCGDKTITLSPNTLGTYDWTDTIFFDSQNKAVRASSAHCMNRLDPDMHMSSISFPESELSKLANIGEEGLTLTVKGDKIKDADGKSARSATYTGVPRVDFYTQFYTSKTGMIVKGDDTVQYDSLVLAGDQIDVELGLEGTGIAETLVSYGSSLAVYSPRENVYVLPEHRYGFRTSMYDLEGYGGNLWNGCVSSISETNIHRMRQNTGDQYMLTMYPNENVLIHEFGHMIKSVGLEENPDQSYADNYFKVYEHALEAGLWPNTYAISNSDEFFATMCAIWFNNMDDVSSWNDGTRCPINTRAEMEEYDPMTYDFFKTILPADMTLPSPWDEPSPDNYHGGKIDPPVYNRAACREDSLRTDVFRLETSARGSIWQVDRYAADSSKPQNDLCLWTPYGTDGDAASMINGPWRVTRNDDGTICLSSMDGGAALTAKDENTVTVGQRLKTSDDAQKWRFVTVPTSANPYAGHLINVKYGTALAHDSRAKDGAPLMLAPVEDAPTWFLLNTTQKTRSRDYYLEPHEIDYVPHVETEPVTEEPVVAEPVVTEPVTTSPSAETAPQAASSKGCGSASTPAATLAAAACALACAYVVRRKRK